MAVASDNTALARRRMRSSVTGYAFLHGGKRLNMITLNGFLNDDGR